MKLVYGLVKKIEHKPLRIQAVLPDMGDMLSPWAQVLVGRSLGAKDFHPPVKGEQVALILDDNGETALCLGSVYSDEDNSPADDHRYVKRFDDGTQISYDSENSELSVSAVGVINIVCEGDASIKAENLSLESEVTISKGLTVENDVVISGKSFLRHTNRGLPLD